MAKKKAKTKNAKGSKSKPGSLAYRYKALSDSTKWILFILLVILGIIGYNLTLDALERRKFNEMEKTVDTLVEQIDREFRTSGSEDTSHCYESSRKFSKGPTICVYSRAFKVHGPAFPELTAFIESATDVVSRYSHFRSTITDFQSPKHNGSCSFDYDKVKDLYELGCSSYARKSYYLFTD